MMEESFCESRRLTRDSEVLTASAIMNRMPAYYAASQNIYSEARHITWIRISDGLAPPQTLRGKALGCWPHERWRRRMSLTDCAPRLIPSIPSAVPSFCRSRTEACYMHRLVADNHIYSIMVWRFGYDPKTDATTYGLRSTRMFSARKGHVVG